MPNESREHPAADKTMRWLGNNWWVPIVSALTLEAITRGHAPHGPGHASPGETGHRVAPAAGNGPGEIGGAA